MTRRHLAWLSLLGLAGGLLTLAGRSVLSGPAPDPARFAPWVERVGPAAAAMALLRLVALGGVIWLAAAVLIDGLVSHQRRPVVLALPGWLQAHLHRAAAVSLAISPLVLPATHTVVRAGVEPGDPAPDDAPDPSEAPADAGGGVAILRPLPPAATTTASTTTAAPPSSTMPAPTPSPAPSEMPSPSTAVPPLTTTPPTTAAQPAAVPVRPSPQPDRAAAIEEAAVSPGESLWRLAEERLAEHLPRAPSDAEIAPYWAAVVDANRDRLRSGDPDVIYPGEQIVLPAIT